MGSSSLRWLNPSTQVRVAHSPFSRPCQRVHKPEAQPLKEYLKDKIRKIDPSCPILLDGFSDLGETEAMILYRQVSAENC
jgi:uncharacterized protein